jgi:hypothetical protein
MAYEQGLRSIGVPASADLSSDQFLFVTTNSSGQLALTAAGAVADGILQDKPNGQGVEGQVGILGVSKVVTGAAVTAGDALMVDGSGRAITATAGNWVRARALASSGGAGVIIPVLLTGGYFVPSGSYVNTLKARVALTAAQIATLHSAPVPLVAAPGAGYALAFEWMTLQFTYGSVQFTGGGVVAPVYHGATADLSVTGGVAASTIQAAANADLMLRSAPAAGGQAITANAGIDLYAASADFAAGNSTAVVELSYALIQLG